MAHAEKCPVCGSTGKVKDNNCGSKTDGNDVECHGCGGKGWVEVSDSYYGVIYYPHRGSGYYDEYGIWHYNW